MNELHRLAAEYRRRQRAARIQRAVIGIIRRVIVLELAALVILWAMR